MSEAAILESPLAGAEFLAVDTETQRAAEGALRADRSRRRPGRRRRAARPLELAGRRLRAARPRHPALHRDHASDGRRRAAARAVLPELAEQMKGRILVAHSARFDVGVLKQAFERAELEWPDPPVMCTVALARRLAPLQRRRGLASLADALGIEVEQTHRALPDAEACARVCARCCRGCAPTRARWATRCRCCAPARRRSPSRGAPRAGATTGPTSPRSRRTRASTSSARRRPSCSTSASRSACERARERASRRPRPGPARPSASTAADESELGALVLENRLIKALKPPGNARLKKEPDGYVYLRCRLDIPFPILEVAQARRRPRGLRRPGPRARRRRQLVEQLNSLFGLRHCGRGLHAPAPVGLRADGPLPVALPRRPRPQPLPRTARPGARPLRGRRRSGAAPT